MKKYVLVLLPACLICICAAVVVYWNSQKASVNPSGVSVKADVDLTVLNPRMLEAAMRNIMANPKDYLDKTIKIIGAYDFWCSEDNDCHYFVVVADAAECCKTGIEFKWKSDTHSNYPEKDAKIEITGVFGQYEKLNRTYYRLIIDNMNVL